MLPPALRHLLIALGLLGLAAGEALAQAGPPIPGTTGMGRTGPALSDSTAAAAGRTGISRGPPGPDNLFTQRRAGDIVQMPLDSMALDQSIGTGNAGGDLTAGP